MTTGPMEAERKARLNRLDQTIRERILILDGAMGTMIQAHKLDEAGYRGTRLKDRAGELKGNNDLLSLTQPDIIRDIHKAYLQAGADIIETNTFNATTIAQADYALEDLVGELNYESARLARQAADEAAASGRTCWVAGVLGPTNRTSSMSPDVNDPGFRNITFDELRGAYRQAAAELVRGGADLVLVETVFDTLNAKAALVAIEELFEALGWRLPIMISGTITDKSGRTLSGQTPEAFWYSVAHVKPFSIGLNCALGAKDLRPHLEEISAVAETHVSVHPNAGLPNEFGGYDESPDDMADVLEEFARAGLVNIVGGCCGTTPDHIRAIAERMKGLAPRSIPDIPKRLRLSGLEPFVAAS